LCTPKKQISAGIANPSTAKWFNTAAFSAAPLYTFGNAGLGIIEGPGTFAINTSLSKKFYIKEQKSLQFRWETFNTTNRANYSNPTTALSSSSYGKITSAGNPRNMQLAVRLRSYAFDDEEEEIVIRCIGAPIFDGRQRVIAAADEISKARVKDFRT